MKDDVAINLNYTQDEAGYYLMYLPAQHCLRMEIWGTWTSDGVLMAKFSRDVYFCMSRLKEIGPWQIYVDLTKYQVHSQSETVSKQFAKLMRDSALNGVRRVGVLYDDREPGSKLDELAIPLGLLYSDQADINSDNQPEVKCFNMEERSAVEQWLDEAMV